MRPAFIAFLCVISSAASQEKKDDIPPAVRRIFDHQEKMAKLIEEKTQERDQKIVKLREAKDTMLARLAKSTVRTTAKRSSIPEKGPIEFVSVKAKKEYIAKVEDDYTFAEAEAKADTALLMKRLERNPFPTLFEPLKVGDVGKLPGNQKDEVFVLQVISPDSCLVKLFFLKGDMTVMVKGVSMKGIVDRKDTKIVDVFEITGTTRYKTVVGSNTVFVLERFDTTILDKYRKAK